LTKKSWNFKEPLYITYVCEAKGCEVKTTQLNSSYKHSRTHSCSRECAGKCRNALRAGVQIKPKPVKQRIKEYFEQTYIPTAKDKKAVL
jgi:hypothetical protein